jgi:hypothetical protein
MRTENLTDLLKLTSTGSLDCWSNCIAGRCGGAWRKAGFLGELSRTHAIDILIQNKTAQISLRRFGNRLVLDAIRTASHNSQFVASIFSSPPSQCT